MKYQNRIVYLYCICEGFQTTR